MQRLTSRDEEPRRGPPCGHGQERPQQGTKTAKTRGRTRDLRLQPAPAFLATPEPPGPAPGGMRSAQPSRTQPTCMDAACPCSGRRSPPPPRSAAALRELTPQKPLPAAPEPDACHPCFLSHPTWRPAASHRCYRPPGLPGYPAWRTVAAALPRRRRPPELAVPAGRPGPCAGRWSSAGGRTLRAARSGVAPRPPAAAGRSSSPRRRPPCWRGAWPRAS